MERIVRNEDGRQRILACALVAMVCAALVFLLSACGEEITITIQDGMDEATVKTTTGTKVEKVLEDAEITLGENDAVTPELSYKITADDTMIVIARYAEVTIEDEEDTYVIALVGGTVQDALDEVGIEVGENDVVDQDLGAYLTDGMKIVVLRAYTEEVVETEEIAYETTYEDSSSITKGQTSVKQEGENGEKAVTYAVTYDANGNELSREVIGEEVTKEPVDEIILQGTKTQQSSSATTRNGKVVDHVEKSPDCDDPSHGFNIYYYADGSMEEVRY